MIISYLVTLSFLILLGICIDIYIQQEIARQNRKGRNMHGQFLPKPRKVIFYGDLSRG